MVTLMKKLRITSALGREILSEYIATFILVTFCVGSGAQYVLSNQSMGGYLTINFAGGMGLMFAIYWAGGVSGGLVNPAVTLGLCLNGMVKWYKLPFYAIAQLAGAFSAAAVQYAVYHDALDHYDGGNRTTTGDKATAGIFCTFPQEYVSTTNALIDQIFGTFILIGCIFAIVDRKNMNPDKGLQPLVLGLIVFAIGTSLALNCGYPINPARDLGPRIFTAIAGWGLEPFSIRNYNWFWVPIVGPFIGAILAWLVYSLTISCHWPDEDTYVLEDIVVEEGESKENTVNDNESYSNKAFALAEVKF